eukprot:TRINITY_DN18422_c0_g1_i1.p1 TRINITY_DN18422_c0_g1~~TRINITY_DN18422_c0_g1_i1.p1  ORF type:complete len:190 (-),score=15.31 TRINITY_DN18422_c0_g1_i1:877-1446(-)
MTWVQYDSEVGNGSKCIGRIWHYATGMFPCSFGIRRRGMHLVLGRHKSIVSDLDSAEQSLNPTTIFKSHPMEQDFQNNLQSYFFGNILLAHMAVSTFPLSYHSYLFHLLKRPISISFPFLSFNPTTQASHLSLSLSLSEQTPWFSPFLFLLPLTPTSGPATPFSCLLFSSPCLSFCVPIYSGRLRVGWG